MKPDPESRPSPALDWVVSTGAVDQVFSEVEAKLRRRHRHRNRIGAAAAGLLVLLTTGVVWKIRPVGAERPAPAVAAPSEIVSLPTKQVLSDGSVIELNAGARITLDFEDSFRRVILERGEAHFEVTKNPSRPFVVVAGRVEVRAVGTAFAVKLGAQAVDVLVTEGRVAVENPPASDPASGLIARQLYAHVDAGQRVVVDLAAPSAAGAIPPPVLTVSSAELGERLAWRVPRLEFSGTPLAEALALFNRHNRVRLVLSDPSLASLELSGVMRADNTDSLLRLLRAEFGIEAERRGEEIVLHRRR